MKKKHFNKLLHQLIYLLVSLIFIIVILSWESNSMPDLRPWNRVPVGPELLVNKDYDDIDSYLKDEDAYIRKMFALVADSAKGMFNRYNPKSFVYPFAEGDNMNASFVLDPGKKSTKGVILLLHGLSDSPYHMRDLGKAFYDRGFYVLGLRLPGHGTLPTGLLDVTWQQWLKACDWGAEQVYRIAGERGDVPFYMGGFSTGGALVLNYSYRAMDDKKLHKPGKLFLFSPAIGVSKLAIFSAWHKSISWHQSYEKLKWLDILPEYDPAKYNSFTKNAGRQIYLLTQDNKKRMAQLVKDGRKSEFPSMISFQSLVDATVIPDDLLELYQEIGTSKDELFLFDVNRVYADFMVKSVRNKYPEDIRFSQESKPVLRILHNNLEPDTVYGPIACGVYERAADNKLKDVYPDAHTAWPVEFFAISHIAVPIAPENKAYGRFSTLGRLSVHGERSVLVISSEDLMRIRYNPFFDLMKMEIYDFMDR